MNIKKIMLITIVLLAVLTISAVSADDSAGFNETLTVEDGGDYDIDVIESPQSDFILGMDDESVNDLVANGSSSSQPNIDEGNNGEENDDSPAGENENKELYRDAVYFLFTRTDTEFKDGVDLSFAEVILRPDTTEGRLVISDGDLTLFDGNITDNTQLDGQGNLRFRVYYHDLNLTDVADGDEITFIFYDGNGDEVEIYTTSSQISLTQNGIRYVVDESADNNFIFISNLEYSTDENSPDYSETYIVGGIVLDSQTTSGYFAGFTENNILFYKKVNQSGVNGWHTDANGNLKTHLLFRDLNLTNVTDNQYVLLTFFDENWMEVESFRKIVNIAVTDSTIQFCEFYRLWADNFESKSHDWADVIRIDIDNYIENARIVLNVEMPNGTICSFPKSIEGNRISWVVSEICDECGMYNINVTYEYGNSRIDLMRNHKFQLTELDIYECNNDVYVNYPFDVLRIMDDDAIVEVYVKGNKYEYGSENPFTWTLADLNIAKAGKYDIKVISLDDVGDEIENITFTLNVRDMDYSQFNVFAYNHNVLDLKNPVLYIFCPERSEGKITIQINDESLESVDVTPGEWMNYTLDELGIDTNGDYNVIIYNDDNEIGQTCISVWSIISEKSFNYWISSHETQDNTQNGLFEIWLEDNALNGFFALSIEKFDGTTKGYEIEIEENDVQGSIEDFDIIDECGSYRITLSYENDELSLFLAENHGFYLTTLHYDFVEDVFVESPFDVIRFYNQKLDLESEDSEFATIQVFVNDVKQDFGGENPFRWTLNDLGIDEAGEYNIRIEAFDGDNFVEEIEYTLNVDNDTSYIRIFSNELGVRYWEIKDPVLYIISPDENIGDNLTLCINDYEIEFEIKSGLMSWTLDELGIYENGDYELRVVNEDGDEIASTWLNVEGFITEENFNVYLANHNPIDDDGNELINIGFDDKVGEGTIFLSIENPDGEIQVYEEHIGDSNICWRLNDLDILDELGKYTLNITFEYDEVKIVLAENHELYLTKLSYDFLDNVFVESPFDVIRFYNQKLEDDNEDENENEGAGYVIVKVYVDGVKKEGIGKNPLRWTLNELGIAEAGEYNVRIEAFDGDDFVEEIEYTLNVDNDTSNIRIFSNDLSVRYWEVKDPAVYLVSPDENIGDNVTLYINNEEIEFEIKSGLMSWTLDELGIYENGDYELRVVNEDGDEIASTWLNVDAFITEECFDYMLPSHICKEDSDRELCNVYVDDTVGEGTLFLSIEKFNGTVKVYSQSIEDYGITWELKDLDIIDECGPYSINLTFVYDDVEIKLVEDFTLYLTQMILKFYDLENIYIKYPFDIIELFSIGEPEWAFDEYTVEVYVNDNHEASQNSENDPLRWTLKDLGIDEAGENTITIKLFNDEGKEVESITFNLNVYNETDGFELISNKLGVNYWDFSNPVVYLEASEEYINQTFILKVADNEFEFNVTSTFMNWTLADFGICEDGDYDISVVDDEGREIDRTSLPVQFFEENRISVEIEDKTFYNDSLEQIIYAKSNTGVPGVLTIIVNNQTKFVTKIATNYADSYAWARWTYGNNDYGEDYDYEYLWDLKSLGITQEGEYNITVKTVTLFEERSYEATIHVETFNNDTFRARLSEDDERYTLHFFAPDRSAGNITVHMLDEDNEEGVLEFVINESYWNKWTVLVANSEFEFEVFVGDEEIPVEGVMFKDYGNDYEVNTDELNSGDVAIWAYVESTDSNCTINVTNGDYKFNKKITDLGDYEWRNGVYRYVISLEDLDSFNAFNDKDEVVITLDDPKPKGSRVTPLVIHLKKSNGILQLVRYEEIRIDVVAIRLVDDDNENYLKYNVSNADEVWLQVIVPQYLNIEETAVIQIVRDGYTFTRKLSEFESYDFDYSCFGGIYNITLKDLNIATLKNHELIKIYLTSNDKVVGNKTVISYFEGDDTVGFEYFQSEVGLIFHYGQVGNTEFGQGSHDGNLIILTVPRYLNITEGTIKITADDGSVLYSKSLAEFGDNFDYEDDLDRYVYTISDSIEEFDYSCIPENVNFTVSFTYGNTTVSGIRGVRTGDQLERINTPQDIAGLFKITMADNVLCNDSDNVITFAATDHANRMSIFIDIGGGYFAVYVNGKKVEDLGRLIRIDSETELELFRLYGDTDGNSRLQLYLSDLNITENGVYAVRIVHVSEDVNYDVNKYGVTEIFNKNVTLTSNVKPNYQNSSTEALTGYGLDPDLLYLDTYYGQIDEVTGKITVLNANGEKIHESDIRSLPLKDGRRYLKYSDFKDDFKDTITLKYSDGNERNGETVLDVLWRNVTSEDFAPVVKHDIVNDYYGDFLNFIIPDAINEGQIIVTVKFKGNHTTNIPDLNVSSDFGSQAVYKFNVAEIKANYNVFSLSLYDLSYYEENGLYDVDVKFSANGVDFLNIVNNTFDVDFLKDIIISINETSRYGMELPFASVKIFEPLNAYGELYIDGKIYSHKSFEKGLITFMSSPKWAPGNHKAEVLVFDSEFGTLLNSSVVEFETLIGTDDVTVSINTTIKENENAIIIITVPEAGNLTVIIDGGTEIIYPLNEGENSVDLGTLSKGNHTVWIEYVNGNGTSFYNNYIIITVGDDGSWLDFPDRIEVNGSDVIKINVGEGAQGYILIYIDGKLVDNCTVDNGTLEVALSKYLTGSDIYGMHNYTIEYYDLNGNMVFSRNGTFYVTYIFHDNIGNKEVPFQDYYIFIVTLPKDATGKVKITVISTGYTDTQPVVDGQAIFYIPGLPMGEHDILVEYLGDDKYPPSSYHALLNVSHYGVVGIFENGKWTIKLNLPKNATGNMIVYNINRQTMLYNVSVADGAAKAVLENLTIGRYDIRAYYDANDYDVRDFTTSFKVMPDVFITQNATIGEDVNIFMDLDNATGMILIVMDGLSPVLVDIVDGKVNYTFSTKDYVYGNHTVYFMYFGTSFDATIFSEQDETGKTSPIEYGYYLEGLQLNATPTTDYDNWLIINCGNATGTITVFVNGVKWKVIKIVNGIAMINLAELKDGEYNLTFLYSGDNSHMPSLMDILLLIKHKTPSIVANDMNMDYTSGRAYSVTVYTKNGLPAANVAVTFMINNNAVGNAITDSKGVASIVISNAPGTYKITAKALDVSVTKQLKVNKILSLKKVKVKKSAKKLVLTANLKKINGKYLKGKKIVFKFKGKKYTAKTNKKGVAKVTIKKKVLKKLKKGKKVTYQATYLKDTVKRTVKVK